MILIFMFEGHQEDMSLEGKDMEEDVRLVEPDPMERLVVPETSERLLPTSCSPERLLVPSPRTPLSPGTPESRGHLSPGTPESRGHRVPRSPGASESIEVAAVARRSPSVASAKL